MLREVIGNRERISVPLRCDDPRALDPSFAHSDWERAYARGPQKRYPIQDRATIVDAFHGRCLYCGEECGDCGHIDHVIPISAGGSNAPWNLALACATCNLQKHDRNAFEFGDAGAMDLAWLLSCGLVDIQWSNVIVRNEG